MPLQTSKLNRRSSSKAIQEAISDCIETTLREYKETGKIGNITPDDEGHARRIAQGLCYADARRHAGSKVPAK